MKHWKNLLACLLAGVLALGVLTACSGLGSVNTGTDAEKAAELAQQLGVAHTQELDNTAKAVAEWFVQEPDSLRVSGLDLVYTVALDADGNMGYTDNLNHFLYWSGCYGVPDDVTVALLLDDSTAMTARLYAPQADSAAAQALGCSGVMRLQQVCQMLVPGITTHQPDGLGQDESHPVAAVGKGPFQRDGVGQAAIKIRYAVDDAGLVDDRDAAGRHEDAVVVRVEVCLGENCASPFCALAATTQSSAGLRASAA